MLGESDRSQLLVLYQSNKLPLRVSTSFAKKLVQYLKELLAILPEMLHTGFGTEFIPNKCKLMKAEINFVHVSILRG